MEFSGVKFLFFNNARVNFVKFRKSGKNVSRLEKSCQNRSNWVKTGQEVQIHNTQGVEKRPLGKTCVRRHSNNT